MAGGIWEVIGSGGGAGGIKVRTGKDLGSREAHGGRLATGSLVAELELSEDRLRFTRVTGSGPNQGWVSLKAKGVDLLVRAGAQGSRAAIEAETKVTAAAVQANGQEETAPNIWLMAQGTRGDVQPLVALGQALLRKGYRVKVLASSNFRGFVESYGLRFLAHGVDIQSGVTKAVKRALDTQDTEMAEQWKKLEQDKDAVGAEALKNTMNAEVKADMARVFADALQAERPDLIAFTSLLDGIPLYAWRKYGIPCMNVMYFPINAVDEEGMRNAYDSWLDTDKKIVEAETGVAAMSAASFEDFVAWWTSPRGAVVPHSPELLRLWDGAQRELAEQRRGLLTGFWLLDEAQQLVDLAQFGGLEGLRMMQRFLDAGPPPICVGWGSMPLGAPVLAKAITSIKLAGCRGIVVGGWAGVGITGLEEFMDANLPEDPFGIVAFARKNILFVKSAPHGWLFPRCAATVHHGGAGTTAAALLAGVPTIVTPFSFDQQYHADWVEKLGCGLQLNLASGGLADANWSKAFQKAVADAGLRAAAREVAQVLKREPGVAEGVARVEAVLRERARQPDGAGPVPGRTLGF